MYFPPSDHVCDSFKNCVMPEKRGWLTVAKDNDLLDSDARGD